MAVITQRSRNPMLAAAWAGYQAAGKKAARAAKLAAKQEVAPAPAKTPTQPRSKGGKPTKAKK